MWKQKYFGDNIIKELISWKINELSRKKYYYEAHKLPINICSISKYKKNCEPLFLEEFKAQINQLAKFNTDSCDLSECNIVWKGIRQRKFLIELEIKSKKAQSYCEGDFVILFKNLTMPEDDNVINFGLIIKKSTFSDNKVLIEINFESWKNNEIENKKTNLTSVRNLSTIKSFFREYQILNNLQIIPSTINKLLFTKKKILVRSTTFREWKFLSSHLNHHFNDSQIKSIIASVKNKITLIQGPPGTGKTRTILGIIFLISYNSSDDREVKCFHLQNNERLTNFRSTFVNDKQIFSNLRKNRNIISTQTKLHTVWKSLRFVINKRPKRIVICAFSNTAIDENTARITFGLPMKKIGETTEAFSTLRLGPNYKFFLDHITMDSYALIWASDNDSAHTIWHSTDVLRKSRASILKKSKLVYTTLACAAYPFLEKFRRNETILIDEAAQAVEISTLVPLRSTCEKLVMIGDIQQLPATVFSQSSVDLNYERSLFKRLQLQNFPVYFLETQYRMHPQISTFISRKFYNNGLKDSINVRSIQNFHTLRCFGPIIFFDAAEGLEQFHRKQKNSWCNIEEIRVISLIIRSLICLFPTLNLRSIGIIASYHGQIAEIEEHGLVKRNEFKGQINTVDGFQGREKNIILFSSVRAKHQNGIGFLSDCRRMNVALTRAKFSFWGLGKASTLQRDINWLEGLFDLRKRGRFFSVRRPLERSNRKLIYWHVFDEKNFSDDGETFSSSTLHLLNYVLIVYR